MPKQPLNIIQITDCHDSNPVSGNLAAVKVKLYYSELARAARIRTGVIDVIPAEEFNTIDVGAKFSEMATNSHDPKNVIVAVNAAPPGIPGGNGNNERKNFVLGRLKNGMVFGGTWAGHCLSYVKSQIAALYELRDSNNGSQFRSYEVLPPALMEFATGNIEERRLSEIFDIAAAVPGIPAHSHVFTIDNFKNVKLVVSGQDLDRLQERLERHAALQIGNQNKTMPDIGVGFGRRSVEFGADSKKKIRFYPASLAHKMFNGEPGRTVLSLTSSARRWNAEGIVVDVPQLASIRREPHMRIGFPVPNIGARLHLRY